LPNKPAAVAMPGAATAPLATTPPASAAIAPSIASAPAHAAGVSLASAPGQYRPGGTSSYTGSTSVPIEVAIRPASPGAPPAPASSSAGNDAHSQPWAPPANTAPAPRRY
jgi:hypothetical protein